LAAVVVVETQDALAKELDADYADDRDKADEEKVLHELRTGFVAPQGSKAKYESFARFSVHKKKWVQGAPASSDRALYPSLIGVLVRVWTRRR
jgi:glutamate synthase domain-containing protein 3